ncbi:hypothetical protein L3C95_12440 [Chitinophaga filiformis]|uniref:hypothetical protein n=1 Tax=Chitinophaga filiformis TaxID=104663 RepID=UPI001F1EF784|nr:hypothetical protein [Chitinophaga filiformis]MCF6403691.1 hypothetical protein [Chitinophaga filiformis]
MKRTLIFIGCTMMAALTCLFVLVLVAGMPNDRKNGFDRQWVKVNVRQQLSYKLPLTGERLFGWGDSIYLSAPSHRQIYSLDNSLHIKDTVELTVNKQLRPPVNFFADATHIYAHEYNSGKLFFKELHAAQFDSARLSAGPFVKSLQLSDSLVVIRGFVPGSFQPVFMRINILNGEQRKSNLLSEKADAGFSTDGILCSNTQKDRLFYIPYFENGIYCMDNELNLRYKQHTIDTVFHNDIRVAGRGDGEMQKLYASAPRVKVNKRAFANDRLLFIESDLQADNEQRDAFSKYPVLDTYYVENGSYAGSFYLPVDKKKVLSYYVNAEKLYVLLKDEITLYTITLPSSSFHR